MSQLHLGVERILDAPADTVYRLIADYHQHHRVGGFLPDAFTDLRVDRGGVGAGTVITFCMQMAGRTRTMTHHVTEPEPGRVLVEADDQVRTTFTVDRVGQQARVRIDTVMQTSGLEGLLTRLFAPRMLRRVFEQELDRIERRARAQPRSTPPAAAINGPQPATLS
jgi:hypothetical protein